jgi:hypothetical protein
MGGSRLRAATCALVLILLGASPSMAQLRGGIKGGAARSTIMGEDVGEAGWRSGWVGGLFLVQHLGARLAVQPEVLFMRKGMERVFVGNVLVADASVEMSYLEVPVLFKLFLRDGGAESGPFLMAGPSAGYRTSCEAVATAPDVSFSIGCADPQIGVLAKSLEWNALIGGGTGIAIGRVVVSLEARYEHGLTSLDDSSDDLDLRNRSFAVMTAVSIPLSQWPSVGRN